MELLPRRPPGRADRKAAAYAVQIARLRGAGYTYEAIREAIADVGIELSTSALRREVRRLRGRSQAVLCLSSHAPQPAAAQTVSISLQASSPPAPLPAVSPRSRGHEIAEAFFNANPSHPLVHTKEIP